MFFISKKKMCSEVEETVRRELLIYKSDLELTVRNEVKSFMKEYAKDYTITVWEDFIKGHFVNVVKGTYAYNSVKEPTDAGKLAEFMSNYIRDIVMGIRSNNEHMFFNSEDFIDQIVERINKKQIGK